MEHADSLRINVAIADMHKMTARVIDFSNEFHHKKVCIHERVCVSTPPYYLYWFETSYLNVPLNQDDGPLFLQLINGIKGTKPSRQ